MQIHRVQGQDIKDALERARGLVGDDAVLLGHEATSSGGVTVSVARRPQEATPMSSTKTPTRLAPPAREPANPGLRDVQRRLLRHGCSSRWSQEVRHAVAELGGLGTHAIDVAATVLGRAIQVAPSPKVGSKARAFALVGPTGVGKTTTLAKLAVQLTRAGRRVGIVSLDTYRAGALEQLSTYAELLGCSVDVARDGEELAGVLERSKHLQAILIDTAGRSPRVQSEIEVMSAVLDRGAHVMPIDRWLVLSAATQRGDLKDAAEAFARLRPDAAIVTKLDETRRPGAVLETLARNGLDLAFLADGQDVAGNLARPRTDDVADLLLRGRLA